MTIIVPPGGFAGYSQMTPASRARLSQIPGRSRSTRRKRKKKTSARRSSSKRKGARKSRMKFGSPAWQKKYKVGKYRK